ncbi:BnaCnng07440D [Brassica napus]|uniref:BnaCnng07440D protein n=2 Tax=Brassica TaxID=3705 RepID=A0A078H7I3_BRANA|nr:BnaCnng07440D [Brassica napus]
MAIIMNVFVPMS